MQKLNKGFDKLVYYSILFFPILDIITSIMTYNKFDLSAGLIIKALIMGIVFLFSFLSKNISKFSKVLLAIYVIFIIGNMVNNYNFILPTPNFEYFKLIIKFSYFIIFVIFFTDYLKNKKYDVTVLKTPIKIILISMFLAMLTGTAMPSYTNVYKLGVEGWFYSANEVGGLLTLLYPITLYLFFHNEESKKIEYVYVMMHAASLLLLGTKVGLLGFLAVSIIYILYRIIFLKKYSYKNGLLLMIVLIISTFVVWDYLPCIKNTDDKYTNVTDAYISDTLTEEQKKQTENAIVNEMIYSGRHNFLEQLKSTKDKTDKSLVEQENNKKSFGYKKIANDYLGYMYMADGYLMIIERDFHDTIFFFGKIGLFLLLFVIVYPILKNLKNILIKLFDIKTDMLLLSLTMVLGIAFISGHTLISPMVSFYISVVLGLIVSSIKSDDKATKKKVLISTVHLDFGGIERTLVNLLKNIDYNKFDVELMLLLNNGPLIKEIPDDVIIKTPYPKILSKLINGNNIIYKVIKHVLFNKFTANLWVTNSHYDVCIDYCGYYNFISYYVANTKSSKKITWVHSQPSCIIDKKSLKKYKFFDKVVFVSNSNKKEMLKLYPQYKSKYTVMWNLVENPLSNGEIINWKNGLKILAVGRLCKAKRFDRMLEIAALLKRDNFEFSIKILGDGPLEKDLKNKAKELDVLDVVEFLGSRSNIGDYMNSADLYLMTSEQEGLPTVILEALTMGLKIVGINIPSLEEIEKNIAPKNMIRLADNNLKNVSKILKKVNVTKKTAFDIKQYNSNNIRTFAKLIK